MDLIEARFLSYFCARIVWQEMMILVRDLLLAGDCYRHNYNI